MLHNLRNNVGGFRMWWWTSFGNGEHDCQDLEVTIVSSVYYKVIQQPWSSWSDRLRTLYSYRLLDFPSALFSPLELTRIRSGASISFLLSFKAVAKPWSLLHLLLCPIQPVHRHRTVATPRTKGWCVERISSTSMDKDITHMIMRKPPIHCAMIGMCLNCKKHSFCPST